MLVLHQSNKLEELFAALLEIIKAPLANIFIPETIIVQSQGMARWLSLEIAVAQGVCANLDCPFPAAYLWRLFAFADDVDDGLPPYEPAAMVWAIMEILEQKKLDPVFEPVSNYWQRQGRELRRYQLAVELSALFDRYLVERPDWIRKWSSGEQNLIEIGHAVWQAELWHTLIERHGAVHRVALFDRFLNALGPSLLRDAEVPERLCLFGIPSMPQGQMEVFAALAQHIDVHIFSLSPCQEFWLDMVSKKSKLRAESALASGAGVENMFMDEGCQLLVGLGGLGRSFQNLLLGYGEVDERSYFVDPGEDTVLTALQSDILAGWPVSAGHELSSGDCSLQIVAAHSPMREVEILADFLMGELNSNDDIEAADILVMMPDITRYAPLVEAVFSAGDVPLPYSIADRRQGGLLTRAFVDLLGLSASRFEVSSVLAFLGLEPVRQRFSISGDELQSIEIWIKDSGIRWGVDDKHRQSFSVPPTLHATWRQGLDRMLLGLALPGQELFAGLLPYDLIEGSNTEALSKLLDFFADLTAFVEETRHKRTLSDWADLLGSVLDDFFDEDESWLPQRHNIRTALDRLTRNQAAAASREAFSLAVITAALVKELDSPGGGGNFLCGRITFCQLVPMRTIPFKVICLLGMNSVAFPRQDRPLGFDLMAAAPRPGDRSRREDDRYLFLETILAARQTLYMSYLGVSDRDNRVMPPSVVISEVLEHLATRYSLSPDQVKERFVAVHPLQPFSRRYFNGQFTSYSSLQRAIVENLGSADRKGLFVDGFILPQEESASIDVSLQEFIAFFEHPVRYLFRRRLGVFLDDYYQETVDRECFDLNALDKYKLINRLTTQTINGDLVADFQEVVRQEAMVPDGDLGGLSYLQCLEEAEHLVQEVNALGGGEKRTVSVDLDLGRGRVRGRINLQGTKQIFYRPGMKKNYSFRDLISSWLTHLLLCASCSDVKLSTYYLFLDGGFKFERQQEAVADLRQLMELFVYGQRQPLPLFPKSSMKYAKSRFQKNAEEETALTQAAACWQEDSYFQKAERLDPYFVAAFGDSVPLWHPGNLGFARVAEVVLAKALEQGGKI